MTWKDVHNFRLILSLSKFTVYFIGSLPGAADHPQRLPALDGQYVYNVSGTQPRPSLLLQYHKLHHHHQGKHGVTSYSLPLAYVVCRKVMFSVVSVSLSTRGWYVIKLVHLGALLPDQFKPMLLRNPPPLPLGPVGKKAVGLRLKSLLVDRLIYGGGKGVPNQ